MPRRDAFPLFAGATNGRRKKPILAGVAATACLVSMALSATPSAEAKVARTPSTRPLLSSSPRVPTTKVSTTRGARIADDPRNPSVVDFHLNGGAVKAIQVPSAPAIDPSAPASVSFRPDPSYRGTSPAASGPIIRCSATVDDVHKSSSTGIPNVHGRVQCDDYARSIAVTVALFRSGSKISPGHNVTTFGKNIASGIATAPSCVTAYYFGDEGGYVVAPPGYTPSSATLYAKGPTDYIICGPCGGGAPNSLNSGIGTLNRTLSGVIDRRSADINPNC